MSARTAAEVDVLAKLAYLAHSEVMRLSSKDRRTAPLPWEQLPALEQEGWRAAARAVERGLA